MSWTPSTIYLNNIYSERQGWLNTIHDVVPGEQIGVQMRVMGKVTSQPCHLVIGFLAEFGDEIHVFGERTLIYGVGALAILVNIYGYWDPHGLPGCIKVGTTQYAYDLETGTRIESWANDVFHVPRAEYRNLHAWYAITDGYEQWTEIDASANAPLPAINGMKWGARIDFEYKSAVLVIASLVVDLVLPADQVLEGAHNRVYWFETLPPVSDWTWVSKYCPIENKGVWGTKLADGSRVDAVKSIYEGYEVRLADTDAGVFVQVAKADFQSLSAGYS